MQNKRPIIPTAIFIQARTGSSRLPRKVILPFCQNQSIIEILITRLLEVCQVPVVLLTTTSPGDDFLVDLVTPFPVKIFRGPEENVLKRFILASEELGVQHIVRVCADNPFLHAGSINKLIEVFNAGGSDYTSYCFVGNKPAITTHFGLFAEITKAECLKNIAERTNEKLYQEHVTNYLYTHPELFKINFIPAPEIIYERNDIRLTLDTPQDFELQQKIYAELMSQNHNFDIAEIVHYLDAHPGLLVSMKKGIIGNKK